MAKAFPILVILGAAAYYIWPTPKPVVPSLKKQVKKTVHVEPPPQLQLAPIQEDPHKERMLLIKKRFYAGDYGATAQLIESDLQKTSISPSYRSWLRSQYPSVLTSLGWLQIRLADCQKAIVTFQKSLTYGMRNETLKGLAFCHHKEKNFNSSYEYFNQYLEQVPDDLNMLALYADVLESRGSFNEASRTLAKIIEKDPKNNDIKKRLDAMKAKSKEGLSQATLSSNHFLFRYRQGLHDELAQYFSIELESALDNFVETYGFKAPKRIIEITLYPSKNFGELVSHSPGWAQGLFDGRIRMPVTDNRAQMERTLRHELVHALLFEMVDGRVLPSWFNEGLAQRLECSNCGRTKFPAMSSGFLSNKSLSQSFIGYSAAKAKVAYIQSLYLILNLEREMNVDDSLFRIVSSLSPYKKLNSDNLLSDFEFDFADLIGTSEKNWAAKKEFSW